MIFFSRIIGTILFLVFGSQFLFLQMRKAEFHKETKLLAKYGEPAFAQISRVQKIQSPLGHRYYFSVKGKHNNKTFENSERVTQELYHLHSVGSNIEIKLYQRKDLRPLLHIRKNPLPWSNDLQMLILASKITWQSGLVLMIFGYILGPLMGRLLKISKWVNTKRPTPDNYHEN